MALTASHSPLPRYQIRLVGSWLLNGPVRFDRVLNKAEQGHVFVWQGSSSPRKGVLSRAAVLPGRVSSAGQQFSQEGCPQQGSSSPRKGVLIRAAVLPGRVSSAGQQFSQEGCPQQGLFLARPRPPPAAVSRVSGHTCHLTRATQNKTTHTKHISTHCTPLSEHMCDYFYGQTPTHTHSCRYKCLKSAVH